MYILETEIIVSKFDEYNANPCVSKLLDWHHTTGHRWLSSNKCVHVSSCTELTWLVGPAQDYKYVFRQCSAQKAKVLSRMRLSSAVLGSYGVAVFCHQLCSLGLILSLSKINLYSKNITLWQQSESSTQLNFSKLMFTTRQTSSSLICHYNHQHDNNHQIRVESNRNNLFVFQTSKSECVWPCWRE